MRVGVIGLGSIGNRHTKNLLAMGHQVIGYDNALRAIWYEDAQGQARTLDEVIEHEPDAVLICTPASTHAAVARELLALGYTGPLFVEKPLALSSAECDVFRTWPSPVTMVGYMLRFHPIPRAWKEIGGWLAGMFKVRCDNSKYGNDLFELSHEIDLALWLGVTPDPLRDLRGEGAYGRHWFVVRENMHAQAMFDAPETLGDQMYIEELAHFLACVEKQIPTITPFADGIRVVEVCEQAVKLAGANL